MKRRDFLKAGLAAGAAALAPTLPALPGQETPAPVPTGDLDELGVQHLQRLMQTGAETSASICNKYLERIQAVDKSGPTVNSVIELSQRCHEEAERLDAMRAAGNVLGPLHGIPVLLKDNIETADGMRCTAGSLAIQDNVPKTDAFLVQRLRAAGAVVLGKTNLSEWANFRSTKSTSGWSSRGGQTKNPYILDRNPCGSSSGSGAAAAASLATLTVGTETDGSIVCPSTMNGIVGVKPTLGLVTRTGVIPLAHSQDTAGPMCRTVADAAFLLTALAAKDPRDPAAKSYKGQTDYAAFLQKDALKGARIGIARQFMGFNQKVDYVMHEAILAMKDAGAVMVDPANLDHIGEYDATEYDVLLYEFKADINAYLAAKNLEAKSLADLIRINTELKGAVMPYFGQEIFEAANEKGPLTDKPYKAALAKNHRLSQKQGVDALVDAKNLDAVIAPTGSPAWPTDLVNGDHFTGGSSSPAAVAGYPAVTVPAGFVHGMPVGVTFFGKAWTEPRLIALAYAFEQATLARKAPRFLPTMPVKR